MACKLDFYKKIKWALCFRLVLFDYGEVHFHCTLRILVIIVVVHVFVFKITFKYNPSKIVYRLLLTFVFISNNASINSLVCMFLCVCTVRTFCTYLIVSSE